MPKLFRNHLHRTLINNNTVIRRCRPYRVITRTEDRLIHGNEQQKTLVYLSCHICRSCMACCRCYRLGYQILAAAPYTALNHSPIQHFRMLMHLLSLPPSTVSFSAGLLRFIMLTLLMTQCTSSKSTNLFSGPYYCIHVQALPVYTYPAVVSPGKIRIHDHKCIITESTLYWSTL